MTLESLGVEVHSASLGIAKFRAEFIRVWTFKGNAICRERPLCGAQLRRAGIVWRVVTRLRDKPRRAPSSSITGRFDQALQVTTVLRRRNFAIDGLMIVRFALMPEDGPNSARAKFAQRIDETFE